MIGNALKGGLALGAGTSAVVALLNYLKSIRDEGEIEDESRLNDNTLYIPAIHKSAADPGGPHPLFGPGLALTGGVVAAGGAYALVQSVYSYLQKKRRQKLLDEAQEETLRASDMEMAKQSAAQNKWGFSDFVLAFPVAVPLLAALAAGGVTYAGLNKTFPTIKSPESKYPKRIRQVANGRVVGSYEAEKDEEEEGAPLAKKASAVFRDAQDCAASAEEFLVLVTDAVSMAKQAGIRLTSDMLHRAAKDGIGGLLHTYEHGGLTAVVESVKGASDVEADLPAKVAAAALLCRSPRLAPIVRTLAAAEMQEMSPHLSNIALDLGPAHVEKMANVAALMNLAAFRPLVEKTAASSIPLRQLVELLRRGATMPTEAAGASGSEVLGSDAGGSMVEDAENSGGQQAEADGGVTTHDVDPVDQFMELESGLPAQ